MSLQDPHGNQVPLLDPKAADALKRMLIGALLFRLGGEQTFTESELNDITETVGGVQIFYVAGVPGVSMDLYVLRVRDPQRATELAARGIVF